MTTLECIAKYGSFYRITQAIRKGRELGLIDQKEVKEKTNEKSFSNIVVGDELKEYIKDVVNDIADDVVDEALDNINLDNYYTKSETYTKTEVDNLIEGVDINVNDIDLTKNEQYNQMVDSFAEGLSFLSNEVKYRVTGSQFDELADSVYTKTEVDNKFNNIQLNDYYNKEEINTIVDDIYSILNNILNKL